MQISFHNQEIAPKIIEPFNSFHTPPKREKKDKEKKKLCIFCVPKIKGFAIIESKSLEGFLHYIFYRIQWTRVF
jgi:hypothetical protein